MLLKLLRNLQNEAASGGPHQNYGAADVVVNDFQTTHALVQCTPF